MNNEQNNNQNQGQLNNLEANTMASDKQSIKDQGGNEPKPYTPQESSSPKSSNPNDVFTPPAVPDVSSQGDASQNQSPQEMQVDSAGGDSNSLPPKKPGNKTFLIILISIIVIGAAVAGYILLSSDNGEVPAQVIEEEPIGEGMVENQEPPVEEEPTEEGMVEQEVHTSLLSTPADIIEDVVVSPLDLFSIRQVADTGTSEESSLREIVMRDVSGQLVGFPAVMQAIAPNTLSEDVTSSFNRDATFYSYSDENGSWFGVVASLTNEADAESVKESVASLENSIDEVKNFFVSDPGPEGSWADGTAQGVTTRYLTFSNTGAALNYGWSGNNLIISTSYPSFSEVASRL